MTVNSGLCSAILIAPSRRGLYSTTRPGSTPQDPAIIAFGVASSIRTANSFAAKPPKTTECTAPIRVQASIATNDSGTIGI